MGFQNCCVCVETRKEVGTAGFDSGIVGRADGYEKMVSVRSTRFGHGLMFQSTFFQPRCDKARYFFIINKEHGELKVSCLRTLH